MKCEEIHSIIAEASLEELRGKFSDEIEEHLVGCESCRRYRKELLAISEGLERIVLPTPGSLDDKVLAQIHKKSDLRPRVFHLGRVALVVAVLALLMIVMGFFWIYSRYSQPEVIDAEPCKPPAIGKPKDVKPKHVKPKIIKGGAKEAMIPKV